MFRTYSVSELNSYIKKIFETDPVLYDISVEGEISGWRVHSSGHIYFSLKDKNSLIKGVFFRGYHRGNIPDIKDGDKVIVKASVGVYIPRGEYQIYARKIEKSGFGDLAKKFQELKIALEKEGYFNKDRKQRIPEIVNNIGIVSSENAAGFKDMLKILKRENFNIFLRNTSVQGISAGQDISEGIKELNSIKDIDVIIIGRGGGSIEDLWGFNEKIVAESIYKSKIPVISAVGHEIDFLISDFVADKRAETPTAAAEFLVNSKKDMRTRIENGEYKLVKHLKGLIDLNRNRMEVYSSQKIRRILEKNFEKRRLAIDSLKSPLNRILFDNINKSRIIINKLSNSLLLKRNSFDELKITLDRSWDKLEYLMNQKLVEYRQNLDLLKLRLDLGNPRNIIKKGYSIVKDENGEIINTVKKIKQNDKINISVKDGIINGIVKGVKNE